MIKKKNFLGVLIFALLLTPKAKAQFYGYSSFGDAQYFISNALNMLLDVLRPFFELIIGDYSTSEFFFVKILLLILLTLICFRVLKSTPIFSENKNVSLLASIIISVLAVRFIGENNFITAIFLQYGVLGIVLTTILPMIILFYFIQHSNIGTYGRKVFWILYIITMTFIWISKSAEIPTVANWIYLFTIAAAIVFLFFDKSINSYFKMAEFEKFSRDNRDDTIRHLRRQLQEASQDLQRNIITPREFETIRRKLVEKITRLSK